MTFLLLLPAILSFLVLGAHYVHQGSYLLAALSVVMPALLLIRQRHILRWLQVLLVVAFIEWVFTAYDLIQEYLSAGMPFLRAAVIIGGVGGFCLVAARLLQTRRVKARYPVGGLRAEGGALPVEPGRDGQRH